MTGLSRAWPLLLAGLLWAPQARSAAALPTASAQAAPSDTSAAFDQLMAQLDNDEVVLNNETSVHQALGRLRALLPPNDAYRQRRYDYIYCFLGFDNDVEAGFAFAGHGIERSRRAGDGVAEANFHFCRGLYQGMLTNERDSLPEYEAGIRIARHMENSHLVADGLTWRGGAQSLMGEQAHALIDFLNAQRLYEAEHNKTAAEQNLVSIAVIYRRLGEYDKASDYLDESLAVARKKGDKLQQMSVDMERGFLKAERGDPAGAIAPLRQALAISRETGLHGSTGAAWLALAEASNQQRRYAQALKQLASAQAEFGLAQDKSNVGMLQLQSAEAHAGLGQHQLAAREFATAEARIRGGRNMRYLSELYQARSQNEEAMGQPKAALTDLKLKMKADAALARMAKTQLTIFMSYQFDTDRRDLENRKLAAEKASKEQQLAALQRIRGWQRIAIALGGVLLLMLLWLAWRQRHRGRRLHRLANTDALTGAANRRRIEHLLEEAVEDALTEDRPLCVVMLDVDHFKAVNDTYGHQVGDDLLVQIVQACQGALRQFDKLGRMGGEEFLVLLPDTSLAEGMQVAERLRASVEALRPCTGGGRLRVSISLGVAQLKGDDVAPLLRRADIALYRAKDAGRNRTEAEA